MQLSVALDKARILGSRLLQLDLKGIQRLSRVNSLFHSDKIVWNFSNLDKLFHAIDLPMPHANPSALETEHGPIKTEFEHRGRHYDFAGYIQERNVKSFVVLKDGKVRFEEYYLGTKPDDRHISWSMSKSVTALLLAILIDKRKIPENALEYQIRDHVPDLAGSGYDGASLRNVLNMASGVSFNEDYMDYHSDINRMGRVLGVGGSMDEFASTLHSRWPPGRYMHYVSVDTHVIGMMIRALTGEKMIDLLGEHLIRPMALEHDGFITTDDRAEPFVLGGLNMSTRDYARVAQMMLQKGEWDGRRIISPDWVDRMTAQTAPEASPETIGIPDGQLGYGMQWWLPPSALEGEFFGIGIYGQYIYINRPCGVVIAQNTADTNFRDGDGAVCIRTLSMFRQISEALA